MPTTIITGADSRIGASIARRLHADGHEVVLVGQDPEPLVELTRSVGDDRCSFLVADLTSPTICAGVLAEVSDRHGAIDGLVTHVGNDRLWSDDDLGLESWRRAFADQLIACHQLILGAQPALARSGGSAVVVSASSSGTDRAVGAAAAASDGVRNVVRSLALDIGSTRGLRVNGVAPTACPDAAEIADVVAFLLGRDARSVNGAIAVVADGDASRSILGDAGPAPLARPA
ncbi:MAG: SDR family oxidoreductase [Actinomycetota bacterium]